MERIVNAVEGKPDRENIVNVWKDYTGKDAIIVRERATKAIKPKTINSCWRKLLPNVVLDFSGFTTQPIKKAMEKTVAVAEKTVGVAKKDLATPQAFARNPSLVWEFYHYRREVMLSKEPNPGHLAIAECEARLHGQGRRVTVITQNIDELHRRAGTKNLLEIHGSLFKTRCTSCGIVAENYKSPICPALSGKGAPDPETQDARIPVEKLPRWELPPWFILPPCSRPRCLRGECQWRNSTWKPPQPPTDSDTKRLICIVAPGVACVIRSNIRARQLRPLMCLKMHRDPPRVGWRHLSEGGNELHPQSLSSHVVYF
ncbi:NAD-dependent protein deacylase sirtuin-5, mitochondrial isoform X6 [Ailuropoda melanoleuca]|uniref:NAD-dependent protein deacylase sirtuin-5, mitochondrial isoform X6 n=1 Tax=Ailuropoda melanoleuca TaxID=9646 RepID=UPI0014948356|nr:NAD-dependent protein deacylase sirtuin-5, mitochondrial isoform X6 [Ailuropoda melanoleuca]